MSVIPIYLFIYIYIYLFPQEPVCVLCMLCMFVCLLYMLVVLCLLCVVCMNGVSARICERGSVSLCVCQVLLF